MNRWGLYLLWGLIGFLLSIGIFTQRVRGETIKEPSLDTVVKWIPHRSLGLLLMYQIDGQDIIFAHPVKSQGQYRQCKELQFKPKYNEIHVILGGTNPWIYIVTGDPTMYRFKNSVKWERIGNLTKTIWQKPYELIVKE